jgi:hypothetical protein
MSQSVASTAGASRAEQELQGVRDRQKQKEKCDNWAKIIRQSTGKDHFNKVQFITRPEQECYGSKWQKLCCKNAGVPKGKREDFWRNYGKAAARVSINRKRMNVTNGLKRLFQGKCRSCYAVSMTVLQ